MVVEGVSDGDDCGVVADVVEDPGSSDRQQRSGFGHNLYPLGLSTTTPSQSSTNGMTQVPWNTSLQSLLPP